MRSSSELVDHVSSSHLLDTPSPLALSDSTNWTPLALPRHGTVGTEGEEGEVVRVEDEITGVGEDIVGVDEETGDWVLMYRSTLPAEYCPLARFLGKFGLPTCRLVEGGVRSTGDPADILTSRLLVGLRTGDGDLEPCLAKTGEVRCGREDGTVSSLGASESPPLTSSSWPSLRVSVCSLEGSI